MDSICPMITKIICALRTNGQQEIVQSLPLLATTSDWHSQCLQKQLGVLGPHLQKVGQWASPIEKEKINSEEP